MFTRQKQIRCWVCGNLGHKKYNYRSIENIPQEEWWINKNKSSKKKANVQQIETSENGTSENEDFSDESIADEAIVPCSRDHTFSWSGVRLRPKDNVSNYKKTRRKAKFAGVHGVREHPKIKVSHQMDDVILLDSASHTTIFKQKDCVEKIFISKEKDCIHSSGDGELCSNLQ